MKNKQQGFDTSNVTKIVYDFGDASVPPPYHRSYSITLTPENIHKFVHSYGDTISNTSAEISTEQFNAVVNVLNHCEFSNCKAKENEGCTGGTSEAVSIYSETERIFNGSVYHCGGDDYGTLKGDTKLLLSELNKLLPSGTSEK